MRQFRVDLRLLRELGERLISRDEVAVVELVKNAYDADATSVDVIVREDGLGVNDDGDGMDEQDIEDGWLTIGTGTKTRKPRTRRKRRVLGEKGLGRLSLLRLGKKIVIVTQKEGGPCYRLMMDWGVARKKLKSASFTALGELGVTLSRVDKTPFSKGHGTQVSVEELNEEWTQSKVDRLGVFLSRLVDPRGDQESAFQIQFVSEGKRILLDPPEITQRPHYSMRVAVNDQGRFQGKVGWQADEEEKEKSVAGEFKSGKGRGPRAGFWKVLSDDGSGPFEIRMKVWDLDAKELRGYKTLLRDWSGVSLVRDGFRVVQPDVDWLGLDLRRVQNPTLRLSSNQVIGTVSISSDTNPGLIDKTDREGLLENRSLEILRRAVHGLLDLLEKERYKLRRPKGLTRGAMFSRLDVRPLTSIAATLPEEQKTQLEDYASDLVRFRRLLEDWTLGRDRMATMGMMAARLIHEARSALIGITDAYPLIEKYAEKFDPPLSDNLQRMANSGQLLARLFENLDPLLRFSQKRREIVALRGVIESLKFLFKPQLRKNRIRVRNQIPKQLTFRANLTDIYVVFANLLDNSIHWLRESETDGRIIEFRSSEDEDRLVIEIGDSGPGIEPTVAYEIFESGITEKAEGMGLGLSIVRDIVEFYGGRVEAGADEDLGGAQFAIFLPLERR